MKKHELEKFRDLIGEYDNHPMVHRMKCFVQHGDITTYDHCHRVAKLSYLINRKLHLNANEKELIPAAFLHDFFLYDWHNGPKIPMRKFTSKHGFTHSKVAADNARKFFDINDKMHSIIVSHMWPLNITKVPKSREALILCVADKCIALKETLFERKTAKA
ncbi:MAG TPA: HD family phosphohydrolase [Lachnospiraceae bacterium]|nr:HD family phosphohydrolase [Lachnospiraceae bacterium]